MKPSASLVIEKVKDAGVVGAGGAGFPSHIKLSSKAKTLIVNAASCEPLVTSDFALIETRPDDFLKAITLVSDTIEAEESYIAIKKKHKSIINLLKNRLKKHKDNRIKLFILDDFYPAGDEFILVYEITGKTVPERALPLEVGCMVHNVTTLVQIFDATQGIPVTGRFVTIAGEVKTPQDIYLPVGISFTDAINLAGGTTIEAFRIIHGGPMMGNLVNDPSVETVEKTTSMILVLPEDHVVIQRKLQPITTTLKRAKSACCQCSMCTDLCPRGLIGHPLEPHKIMRTIAYNLSEPSENVTSSYLCSECGLCSAYSCPMGLIPHRVNIDIKAALANHNYKFSRQQENYTPDTELRDARKVPTRRLMGRLDLLKYKTEELNITPKEQKATLVCIKLKQHIGVSCMPTIKTGQKVQKGDLIADIPEKALGAKVHSSINGKIIDITNKTIVIKG